MAKEVKYGVIGLGRFGLAVAQSLIESGEDVIAVDVDESRLGLISDQTENVYITGQITEDSLIEAGLDKCEVVIIGIGKNIEASLLAALHCIHLKVPRVIAKANSAEHAQILKMIGAEVIFPEMDTAHRLARTLKNRMLMDFFSVGSGFSIIQATLPAKLVGQTVVESNLRRKFSINIIAVNRAGKVIADITPDLVFEKDDVLILVGSDSSLAKFMNM